MSGTKRGDQVQEPSLAQFQQSLHKRSEEPAANSSSTSVELLCKGVEESAPSYCKHPLRCKIAIAIDHLFCVSLKPSAALVRRAFWDKAEGTMVLDIPFVIV